MNQVRAARVRLEHASDLPAILEAACTAVRHGASRTTRSNLRCSWPSCARYAAAARAGAEQPTGAVPGTEALPETAPARASRNGHYRGHSLTIAGGVQVVAYGHA